MFEKTFFLNIFLLIIINGYTQKLNNVWAFGSGGGMNFNTSPVSSFKSQAEAANAPYYVSSICDREGNLMFYTDGWTFWNRNHFALPKYKSWSAWSGNVMPLICPYPGNDALFYTFAVCDGINPYQFQYITTRMNNSGDMEEVIYPRPDDPEKYRTVLKSDASLVVAGTNHCNGIDYWIVTHSQNALYSFLVTKSGVDATPVVTNTLPYIPPGRLKIGRSNIKFSANSEKLIVPVIEENKILLYSFDNQTGAFSNPMKLGLPKGQNLEDAELSPDGSKLYAGISGPDPDNPEVPGHNICQWDLDAGNITQIESSFIIINQVVDRESCTPHVCFLVYRSLQLGPDGKIYISMRYADNASIPIDKGVSIIEEPNKKGILCRFKRNDIALVTKYMFIGYNYIRSGSFTPKENGIQVQKNNCSDQPVDFSLLFNKIDSVRWDFGDPNAGSGNSSDQLRPQHIYPGAGNYAVRAIIYSRCLADTATASVQIRPDKATHVPSFIRDTTLCVGDELNLDISTPLAIKYSWENGLIYPQRKIDQAGSYSVTIMSECSVERKSFDVKYQHCPCEVYMPNAFTPNSDGKNDVFRPVFRCTVKGYVFKIFHRNGGLIFESSQPEKGWTGRKNEMELPTGGYVWILQYKDPNRNQLVTRSGIVSLIR